MATYKRRAVAQALQAKGFRRRETHHSYFVYYTNDGRKTAVQTKISHGRGGVDIDDALIGRMAQQCNLRTAQFRALVECSLSRADYEALLVSGGHI